MLCKAVHLSVTQNYKNLLVHVTSRGKRILRMCVTQQPVCVPGHIHVLAYLLADTEYILVDIGINGISVQHDESMCVCVCVCVCAGGSVSQQQTRGKESKADGGAG